MKKLLVALTITAVLSIGWLSRGTELDPVLLQQAKQAYQKNRGRVANERYLTIVDYRKSLLQNRLYVYDLNSEKVVLTSRVSHAFRSGILYPTSFSNTDGSEQSCYGTFLTGESYTGKYGYAMRIDGLSATNTNARTRAVVFHPGYTWSAACYMTSPAVNERLINLIKNKSLVVVYK